MLALYPWEEGELVACEQAEAEAQAEAEFAQWLAALWADQQAAAGSGDPCYARWLTEGAPSVAGQWTLLDPGQAAIPLPAWQRDDYVGA